MNQTIDEEEEEMVEGASVPPELHPQPTSFWKTITRENALSHLEAGEKPPQGADKSGCTKDDRPYAGIRVGKFRFEGEIKHFALVHPSKINSETDLFDLLDLWELPTPNYLLETNQSERRRDRIITKENAAGILKQIFHPEIEKKKPSPSPNTYRRHTTGLLHHRRSTRPPGPMRPVAKSFGSQPNLFSQKKNEEEKQEESTTETTKQDDTDLTWLRNYTGQHEGETPDWSWVNKYLHRKTIGVLKAIVSAADMVDGWFLCHGAPSSNEKMLEVAMDLTGSAPTVLVVDDLDWYWIGAVLDAKVGPHREREQKKKYSENLQKVIRRMREDAGEDSSTMKLDEALKDPGKYKDFKECDEVSEMLFYDNLDLSHRRTSVFSPPEKTSKRDLWSYRSSSDEATAPAGPSLTLSGGRIDEEDEMGEWKPRFPWTRGTHFIFSEGFADFSPHVLGRSGFICMHGGTDASDSSPKRTGYIIRDSMDRLKPCILLDNTGAETQMYGKLIKVIEKIDALCRAPKICDTSRFSWFPLLRRSRNSNDSSKSNDENNVDVDGEIVDDSDLVMFCKIAGVSDLDPAGPSHALNKYYSLLHRLLHQKAGKLLLASLEGHSKEGTPGLSCLTMADVLQVCDLYCSNPRLFQKIVVPVDPLQDSSEYILKTLSEGFQRAALESREVGAGNADVDAVETAWRLHEQLGTTKAIKRFWRGFLYACYIIAGFLTTLVAVLFSYDFDNVKLDQLQWPATVLAIIGSLCIGILNLLSADAELNKIQNAQARIVFEIFRFRMRVGKYSLNAREIAEDLESDEGGTDPGNRRQEHSNRRKKKREERSERKQSTNESKKMHASRERFSKSIKDILHGLASHDLYTKENQAHKRKPELYLNGMKSSELKDKHKNQDNFENYVVDQLHLTEASEKCKEIAVSGLMSPDDYFQIRVLPLLEFLDWHEDDLRRGTRLLQIGSMILSGSAVVLGSAGQVEPIPIVVAAATGLFQIVKVMDLERRFEITSAAARELRALESDWRSMGALDHHQPSAIRHLVRTCEQLVLQFETNSAIQVDKSEIGADTMSISPQRHYKPRGDMNV